MNFYRTLRRVYYRVLDLAYGPVLAPMTEAEKLYWSDITEQTIVRERHHEPTDTMAGTPIGTLSIPLNSSPNNHSETGKR
jgi:hypothetical protein